MVRNTSLTNGGKHSFRFTASHLVASSVLVSPTIFCPFSIFFFSPLRSSHWLGFPVLLSASTLYSFAEGNSFAAIYTTTIYGIRITQKERMRVWRRLHNLNQQTGPEVNWLLNALLFSNGLDTFSYRVARNKGISFHFHSPTQETFQQEFVRTF